ncbi:uncharacterized protein LOC129579685 isoform X2 [Sitodiplosis mosellana]|uniref:uncharacterized protein LOC129579685 isoform X2 n=1 Tax=Sitodiplosis mosellana TaxID=263140 RepID=UPI002444D07A|nr:uncharacterized protein LOC129579685 isoform X2 [Sitodiplosis mosellana]
MQPTSFQTVTLDIQQATNSGLKMYVSASKLCRLCLDVASTQTPNANFVELSKNWFNIDISGTETICNVCHEQLNYWPVYVSRITESNRSRETYTNLMNSYPDDLYSVNIATKCRICFWKEAKVDISFETEHHGRMHQFIENQLKITVKSSELLCFDCLSILRDVSIYKTYLGGIQRANCMTISVKEEVHEDANTEVATDEADSTSDKSLSMNNGSSPPNTPRNNITTTRFDYDASTDDAESLFGQASRRATSAANMEENSKRYKNKKRQTLYMKCLLNRHKIYKLNLDLKSKN